MELMQYFSRSILILTAFLLIYLLALRKDAHYTLNRFFLLLGLLTSMLLPLMEIEYTVLIESNAAQSIFKEVKTTPTISTKEGVLEETPFDWNKLGFIGYVLVACFFIVRIIYQAIKLYWIKHQSQQRFYGGYKVCVHPTVDEPFVYGNSIFLKNDAYLNGRNEEIMVHETIHLQQKHWLDMVLSELFIALNWFNPLAWFYAKIIKQNLEFLADKGVLDKGFRVENYIQTIICETMGAEVSVLANHFRFSQNKRRLKMMKNVRKSKWRKLKPLIALPFIAGFLWAFSVPVYEYSTESKVLNSSIVQSQKANFDIKGYVCVQDTLEILNKETGLYERKIIEGPLPGTSIVRKGTTSGTVVDRNGEFKLDVSKGDILVFSFVGFRTKELVVNSDKELVVAMGPTSYELDPSPYRAEFKGKVVPPPPPPPPVKAKKSVTPPPPPPPKTEGKPEFYVVEELPSYQGGMEGYMANLYTRIALAKEKKDLSGIVKVKFVVDTKGNVKDVAALTELNSKEAKEAEQIIAALSEWKPGKQRGKAVNCSLIVPVEFD